MPSSSVVRPVVLWSIGLVASAMIPAGCSSRTAPWPTAESGFDASPREAATGIAANPATKPPRVIPEVIPKPRLFQLPPSLARALPSAPGGRIEPIAFPSKESPTAAEVRSMMRDYVTAMSRHDPASLAAHWSEDGENVNLDTGATIRGRESLRGVFASLFEHESSAKIDIDITSIRPIRDEVAVVDGLSRLSCQGDSPACSRFSAVVAKKDGRWLIESVRESKLDEPATSKPSRPLAELSWLIGHWESLGSGETDPTAATHCFWSAREAYLVRSHTISGGDRPLDHTHRAVSFDVRPSSEPSDGSREITEIIGWDSSSRSIRSWIFSSDGAFGEATWTHDGDRTVVLVDGNLSDGKPVSGTLTISRLGPDEIACRAVGEGLDRLLPPSCDFLRTARTSAAP